MPRCIGPALVVAPLLLIACGDEGAAAEGAVVPLDDGGQDGTMGDGSSPTEAGAEGAPESEDDGANDAGAGSDGGATDDGNEGDGGSSTTGEAEVPPRTCDFAVGCHDGSFTRANVGSASQTPIGCEGETFRPTAAIDLTWSDAPRTMPLLGDLDGDDVLDLVLNVRKGGTTVWRGDGTGDFGTEATNRLLGFVGGWGGDIGDVNGDGRADLMFGDHVQGGMAWINGGAFQFTFHNGGLPSNTLNGAGLADIDGDGVLDAVLGPDQFGGTVDLRIGQGDGSWTTGSSPGESMANIGYWAFGDMDNDGDLDAFGYGERSQGGTVAHIYRNDAGALVRTETLLGNTSGGEMPRQGSVGDIDCDGNLDVAIGGALWRGNGSGSGWTLAAQVNDASMSHLADMNGDGALDLVTQSVSDGLVMHYNDGTGQTWTAERDGLPDGDYSQYGSPMTLAWSIDVGDVDGSGAQDIIRVASFGRTVLLEAWSR